MLDAIKQLIDDIFLSGLRQRIGAHTLYMQQSPTAAALSASFLLNHAPQQPRAERIDYWQHCAQHKTQVFNLLRGRF